MSSAAEAWTVVQIAELARSSEELLLRALDTLDVDVRAAMPEVSGWVLSGSDADELRTLLTEHSEIGERLRMLAEHLSEEGVTATYPDIRDGAASALADGILDPTVVAMTASALDIPTGWIALADSLVSTDARCAWTELRAGDLLAAFRHVDRRLVVRLLEEAAVGSDECLATLDTEATHRLARLLRSYAHRA